MSRPLTDVIHSREALTLNRVLVKATLRRVFLDLSGTIIRPARVLSWDMVVNGSSGGERTVDTHREEEGWLTLVWCNVRPLTSNIYISDYFGSRLWLSCCCFANNAIISHLISLLSCVKVFLVQIITYGQFCSILVTRHHNQSWIWYGLFPHWWLHATCIDTYKLFLSRTKCVIFSVLSSFVIYIWLLQKEIHVLVIFHNFYIYIC